MIRRNLGTITRRELDGDIREAEYKEWEFPAESPVAFRLMRSEIKFRDAIAHVWTLGIAFFGYQITISFERWKRNAA